MRLRTSLAAVGVAAALVLTGCAGGSGDDADSSGAALTIAKPDGAITTESHNPYLGDSSASKYGYAKVIFEPLALVNPTGDLGTTPWLAESVEWNDDYTELTVVPRADVTWSDGEDFTADDIVFTFNMYIDGTLNDTSALNLESATSDGDAVVLKFAESKYTAQARVLHTPIVPEHIWENIDDPNTDPLTDEGAAVGTGPYVLDSWTTESVALTANPDYWGGDLAVPELYYVSYGDNAALTTALVSEEADWAQAFIPQIQDSFLAADDANQFLASPTAGAGTLFMNLQNKPFNDPALRQAIAWTVDRQAYVDVAREGASTPIWSVTGLGDLLADEIDAEYEGAVYSVDTDKAKQILTDAGYTWKDEKLIDPDGEAVSFSISGPRRLERLEHRAGAHRRGARRGPRHRRQGRPARLGRLGRSSPGGHVRHDHPLAGGHRQRRTASTPPRWTRSGSSTARRSSTSAATTTRPSPRRSTPTRTPRRTRSAQPPSP